MESLLFLIAVAVVTLVLDPFNAIGGTAVGLMARQSFFGRSWPLFLGATVVVSGLSQAAYWVRSLGHKVSVTSALTSYAICLGCALVFGAKVFKLTGSAEDMAMNTQTIRYSLLAITWLDP
jgi:hypothetical protein